MRMRKELLIGILIGLSFMLLASLAAAIAPRSRTAYADSHPYILISVGESTLPQGGTTYLVGGLNNMPQDPDDDRAFHPDLRYRFDLERNDEGTWNEANECEVSSVVGSDNYIGTWYRSPLQVGTGSVRNFTIPSNCPVGSYRILATAKYSPNTIVVTATHDLTIIHGPEVSIQLSSDSFYRDTSTAVTLEFNHLNNIQDDPTLSYRADVMRIISENSFNYANDCEGTELGNIVKTGETNSGNFNFENNPSGSIDDPDGDGSVEISGQIPATCPTGRYRLTVELWDSSKSELTSATQEFVVSTDPNATPSSKIELSPPSPVTPGTEIDAIITFYDLQNGANIRNRTDVTKRVNDADVVESSCHSSGIGLGQDIQSTVSRNPIIMRVTVSSSCPAGSYQLKSVISDTAKNEIVSASADFIVGNPDLTPTLTDLSGTTYTAKVGSPFSKQLPAGSGGDGTLTHSVVNQPSGLTLNKDTLIISGVPSGDGNFVVTYKVADADGDEASTTFTIVVSPDKQPAFDDPPSGTYLAKTESPFSLPLPAATSGDVPLTYTVTSQPSLPSTLTFNDTTLRIEGTPSVAAVYNVTYKVEDVDGDMASATFTIDVKLDQKLSFANPPSGTYQAKVDSPFSLPLPAATGGDAPLTYTVTSQPPLPSTLTFSDSTLRIEGTPTTAAAYSVTYKVEDVDGDMAGATFTIDVKLDLEPTFADPPSGTYLAKTESPFSLPLPAATSGDVPLTYTVTSQPTLPSNLTFNDTTLRVEGTPSVAAVYNVTYKVEDVDGDMASATFTIDVKLDQKLSFANPPSGTYQAKVDSPFSLPLPAATGGDAPLTYTVTSQPPLPSTLTFSDSTLRIEGTPTTAAAYSVTYKVEDLDGDMAGATFTIDVKLDLEPTFADPPSGTYLAKTESPFSLPLPAATSGDVPLTYTVTSQPSLPSTLAFSDTTLRIEGTPTAAAVFSVTYKVEDLDGDMVSATFTIDVKLDLKPTFDAPLSGTYLAKTESLFSLPLPAATSGDMPLTYTVTSQPSLPSNLTFNDTTLRIEGTPKVAAIYNVTYKVEDVDGDMASATFTIDVKQDLKPGFDDPLSGTYLAKTESPFSLPLPAATSGDMPLTYTVTSQPSLPSNLTFNDSTLRIEGTPTVAAIYNVTYKVEDVDGDPASTTFRIDVKQDLKPALDDLSSNTYLGKVDSSFSLQLDGTTGGDMPFTYTLTSQPPLPAELSFNDITLRIEGTPKVVAVYNFTYKVEDVDGDQASTTFTIDVKPDLQPALDDLSSNTYLGKVDSQFSLKLEGTTGGDEPFTYTVTSQPPLPAALSFNATTLRIEGTPKVAAVYNVTYKVEDVDGDQASTTFTIDVKPDLQPALKDLSGNTYTAKVDRPFSLQLEGTTSGDEPFTYTVTSQPPLPADLSFNATTLLIDGTPRSAGNFVVTYKVEDVDEDTSDTSFTIIVYEMPSLDEISDVPATKDEAFTLNLPTVKGGKAPFVYTATPRPTELSFNETDLTIEGTPTQEEDVTVTFTVTDDDGDTASVDFQISVQQGDTEPSFPSQMTIEDQTARVGSPFELLDLPKASGGNQPYTYTVTGLPAGLSFVESDTHDITGTPEAETVGNHAITYTVTDRDLDEAELTFNIEVEQDNQPDTPTVSNYDAKLTKRFSEELPLGTGGDGKHTYTASPLPAGLELNKDTRYIEGTPTSAGTTTVTYTVEDEDGDPASADFTITVYEMPSLAEISDVSATKDEAFSPLTLPKVSGGREPFNYAEPVLPAGLSFNRTSHAIEGTPTQVEDVTVTFTVTDADNDTASEEFQISVRESDTDPAFVQTIDNQTAKVNRIFTLDLPKAAGGNAPYTYKLAGPLPGDLVYVESETHIITGTPKVVGLFPITYTVEDRDNDPASAEFTITVYEMPSLGTVDDVTKMRDIPFAFELPEVTGGRGPFEYTLTGDTLPLGLTFHPVTHTITGASEQLVVASVVYSVTDADNDPASVPFTITIEATASSDQEEETTTTNHHHHHHFNNNNNNNNNGGNNNGGNNNGGNNNGGKSNSGKSNSGIPAKRKVTRRPRPHRLRRHRRHSSRVPLMQMCR